MAIRGKFVLVKIETIETTRSTGKKFHFKPRYDEKCKEEVYFSKTTPSGIIKIRIDDPEVQATFKLGEAYYFDAIPVNK